MNDSERGFIPVDVIRTLRREYPYDAVAWTPKSTPSELIELAINAGIAAPERVTYEEMISHKKLALELYLTRTCPLGCTGCSVPVSIRWAKEVRQEVRAWELGIQKLYDSGVRAVKFIGGEVGILEWLPELAGFAADLGMHVSIFTDGVPYLQKEDLFERTMIETKGRVLWMTSVDFPAPTQSLRSSSGRDEELARAYKAERGQNFATMVEKANGFVICHMMLHQPNKHLIQQVQAEVEARGAMFSIGTMQVNAHLYQGRDPNNYRQALTMEDSDLIREQMEVLVAKEDARVNLGQRKLANSRAHLLTTHSVGISQDIGCSDPRIGPPAVSAVMEDGALRMCPVIATTAQVRQCPGCAYAVFRDGQPEWSEYLSLTGRYEVPDKVNDFPSLFYPHRNNDDLKGYYFNT